MPTLWLGREREEEIVAELASYLEDAGGDGNDTATLCAAVNWARLSSQIRREKETAMDRMKQVVIPGMIALVISSAAQVLCYFLGLRTFVFPTQTTAFVFQWPWLAALPIAGAAAAYAARRNGASPGRRVAAAMFPAVLLTPLILSVGVIEIIYRVFAGTIASFPWEAVAGYFVSWTVAPAAPLLVGAAFFLTGRAEPEAPRVPQSA